IDTGVVIQRTIFTNTAPTDVPVNFAKSVDTVVIITDVRDVNPGAIPREYSLSQNYPNPFNANTQISFALPKAGKTRLEVFNILGQRVNRLVDEYMAAGNKIVNWDGRDERGMDVPSGVYFYRLRSEGFLQTKKMLLIK
ncbi:MAG TPA: T9SS type A sorting domain-containing protein, partial [candidate division Zixibacteria bacterium]|nr:T9SS type A sorting domain-containing protein [candidate division Zixibacteria bacterium]